MALLEKEKKKGKTNKLIDYTNQLKKKKKQTMFEDFFIILIERLPRPAQDKGWKKGEKSSQCVLNNMSITKLDTQKNLWVAHSGELICNDF